MNVFEDYDPNLLEVRDRFHKYFTEKLELQKELRKETETYMHGKYSVFSLQRYQTFLQIKIMHQRFEGFNVNEEEFQKVHKDICSRYLIKDSLGKTKTDYEYRFNIEPSKAKGEIIDEISEAIDKFIGSKIKKND